jgi:cell division protease FtsH
VRRLLEEAHDHARKVLTEQRPLLDKLSALLVVTEVVEGDDLKAYVDGTKPIPDPKDQRPNGRAAAAAVPQPEPAHATTAPLAPPMPKLD